MAKREGTVELATGEVGQWHAKKGTIYVSYDGEERSAYIGGFGFRRQALAQLLLEELVADHLESRRKLAAAASSMAAINQPLFSFSKRNRK